MDGWIKRPLGQEKESNHMFAGHFGLGAAVKSRTKIVPLWAIMLSTQLLDVIFVPLLLTGVETIAPINSGGYGKLVIHADYSHSLLGSLLITLLAGLIASKYWGRSGGIIIASVVFSHWLLDIIVHRMDMPLLPGNYGDLPKIGFSLWVFPGISATVEFILIVVGGFLYFRSLLLNKGSSKFWTYVSGVTMLLFLLASLFSDIYFG